MKKMITGLLAGLFTVMVPFYGMAIELTDYLDPDLQYQDAEIQALFNLKDGNQDQTSFNGSARMEYDMEYSTLPLKIEGYAKGEADFNRGADDEDSTARNFRFDAWSVGKKYLENDNSIFGFGRFDLGLQDLENSNENDPYAKVTVGMGYGRITTATPLMEAYRCVEDLKRYGIIKGELSNEYYLRLATVIAKENEYKSRYSLKEYEKYWYEAMERVFREAGVLTGESLGAMGIIRIQDILTDENVLRRKHGWEVGAGVDYLISDYAGNEGDPGLSLYAEYARPVGFKWQFIDRISYSTILVDWEFGDMDNTFTNEAWLTYEITDKIDWTNLWELDIILASEGDDTYKNSLETGLRFYVSNTIDAVTTLGFDHIDKGDNLDDDIVTTFYFGLAYTIF
ncbi:conserved exported hypothetical protein [Desulfamplus magnetovallimortis]|uniref:Uncharacterized protein n=1 Tax=Desulfamplus magnetovallimortis TaxID=1246637 RepID=A0A1W1HHV8_9BACT|nr:hypothetical protein [Desulfamplus magnetovallimortis]SLM31958.1 conserved exported hypothetical protein [Desulfamplus magnetovallimortis]